MPSTEPEPADRREARRSVVRTLTRLSSVLDTPVRLARDAGRVALSECYQNVARALQDPDEQASLEQARQQYLATTGYDLRGFDPVPPLPVASAEQQELKRVHCCDVQLTFNHAWVPQGSAVADWWSNAGLALAARFQLWASEEFPARFNEKLLHTSLTVEESLNSNEPRVHLHAQFTWRTAIDRVNFDCFKFGAIKPHIEKNAARGKDVLTARARAHFYVWCNKRGTLWRFTDWFPFLDYEVSPHWITSWWATDKLSNTQYKQYLIQCKKSYRVSLQNYQAVIAAEREEALEEYRVKVAALLDATKLPFKSHSDSLFPNLQRFLDQFSYAKERYAIYALQGPSQAAKTSFVKSLFKNPYVITVQGASTLNLSAFKYGHHDALILDNINSFEIILSLRALLQSNTDIHRLGESATGIYSYTVYLWAVPVLATLDLDVQAVEEFRKSEWLCANVWLDVLGVNDKCFIEGDRQQILMDQMPKLILPD